MNVGAITRAEKPLLAHIQLGGLVSDFEGRELVMRFVQRAAQEDRIRRLMYELEFTSDELALVCIAMITHQMPTPCICLGGALLISTLFFAEPERLQDLMIAVRRDAKGKTPEQRVRVLIEKSTIYADAAREANDRVWGEWPFVITKTSAEHRRFHVRLAKHSPGCLRALLYVAAAAAIIAWLAS